MDTATHLQRLSVLSVAFEIFTTGMVVPSDADALEFMVTHSEAISRQVAAFEATPFGDDRAIPLVTFSRSVLGHS